MRAAELAALILVAAGSLVDGAFAQGDVAGQVAALGDADHRRRYPAYQSLLARKPPEAVPLLVKALPDYPIHSQSLGVTLLQTYPEKLSGPALRKLVGSKSAFLRLGSAAALYHKGDRSHVPVIVAALKAPAAGGEASMMLSRLYGIREPGVQEGVRSLLKPDMDLAVLDATLRFLQNTKDPDAIPVVERIVASGGLPAPQRTSCLAFLVGMGQHGHGKALAEVLRGGGVRRFSRISSYLNQAERLDTEVLNAVLDFAERSTSSFDIAQALGILARHGHQAAVPTIRKLLKSDDTRTSKAAFDALLKIGDELDPKSLKSLLDPKRPELCITAADALRRVDDMSGLQPLLDVAGKVRGQTRADAIEALGKFRCRDVVDTLIDALTDNDLNVRTRALHGLGTVLRALFPYRRIDLASVGYTVSAPASKRRDGAALIRVWWKRNRPGLDGK